MGSIENSQEERHEESESQYFGLWFGTIKTEDANIEHTMKLCLLEPGNAYNEIGIVLEHGGQRCHEFVDIVELEHAYITQRPVRIRRAATDLQIYF